jgi:hypothetical protein
MKKYKKEREALKLELKEILETEDLSWNEKRIKEYYSVAHQVTYKLALCLVRLGIPLVPKYEEDYYYYFDIKENFVEKVIHPPEGWIWYDETVEKI